MKHFFLMILLLGLACGGCASHQYSRRISSQDQEAIRQMFNAISAQELTDQQMQNIVQDLQKDPDSKESIERILFPSKEARIKYSPLTGKHYSEHLEFEPETGVRLEVLSE